jgi:hypothetical protein
MIEADWNSCDRPKDMLAFIAKQGKASERKMRLFSCACFRSVWHNLTDSNAQRAIEVAEAYADGIATEDDREKALAETANARYFGAGAVRWTLVAFARSGAMMSVDVAGQTAACPPDQEYDPALWAAESQNQCDLVREMYGPLLFHPQPVTSAWVTWNSGSVVKMAQAIYDERTFDLMPILADALEDASCDDADILNHCRQPGEHVRGCWVVDLLLGKE